MQKRSGRGDPSCAARSTFPTRRMHEGWRARVAVAGRMRAAPLHYATLTHAYAVFAKVFGFFGVSWFGCGVQGVGESGRFGGVRRRMGWFLRMVRWNGDAWVGERFVVWRVDVVKMEGILVCELLVVEGSQYMKC